MTALAIIVAVVVGVILGAAGTLAVLVRWTRHLSSGAPRA